jgi:hypothetical protein
VEPEARWKCQQDSDAHKGDRSAMKWEAVSAKGVGQRRQRKLTRPFRLL